MSIKIKSYIGNEISQVISTLAELRIKVFYEWPYIYDGDLEYEKEYLKAYTKSDKSLVAIAYDGNKAIGATTAIPLEDESIEFQKPLLDQKIDISKVFYLGESILLREYRGQGVGVKFFNIREAHAKKSLIDLELICFAAVERINDHPLKPHDYKELDEFWNRRGYKVQNDLKLSLSWKDRGDKAESVKQLKFWFKPISSN